MYCLLLFILVYVKIRNIHLKSYFLKSYHSATVEHDGAIIPILKERWPIAEQNTVERQRYRLKASEKQEGKNFVFRHWINLATN